MWSKSTAKLARRRRSFEPPVNHLIMRLLHLHTWTHTCSPKHTHTHTTRHGNICIPIPCHYFVRPPAARRRLYSQSKCQTASNLLSLVFFSLLFALSCCAFPPIHCPHAVCQEGFQHCALPLVGRTLPLKRLSQFKKENEKAHHLTFMHRQKTKMRARQFRVALLLREWRRLVF